jgi:hypothetical protein
LAITFPMSRRRSQTTAGLVRWLANLYRPEDDDRRVLNAPEVEAFFVDDMVNAFRGRCLAMVDDAGLLGRDWGFRLADVKCR